MLRMPPKKPKEQSSGGGGVVGAGGLPALDPSDPLASVLAIVDKKARNLEKRKNKLITLKESVDEGRVLDKDQMDAITKITDVSIQLELTRELQKQFSAVSTEFQKARKKQQKLEKQHQKDSEREAQKRAITYTLMVQDMLNSIDEETKTSFRKGTDGAVVLSEAELNQLDDLYQLLSPSRAGNPTFQSDLEEMGERILLLMEQSSREVVGSTYKEVGELIGRIHDCGYFDRERVVEEEDELDSDILEEEQEDTVPEGEVPGNLDYDKPVQDVPLDDPDQEAGSPLPPATNVEDQYVAPPVIAHEQVQGQGMPAVTAPPPAVITQSGIMNYMPSAPSPTFPGLGTVPLQQTPTEEISFMHESEVDRTQPGQSVGLATTQTAPPPPSGHRPEEYSSPVTTAVVIATSQHSTTSSTNPWGIVPQVRPVQTSIPPQASTDVATGQPSPADETTYHSKHMESSEDQSMTSSVPSFPVGQDSSEQGYRQVRSQNRNREGGGYRGSGRGSGGGGYRRGGGRGGRGGYEGNGRGGGGGGYSGYGGSRGRPNYRTNRVVK